MKSKLDIVPYDKITLKEMLAYNEAYCDGDRKLVFCYY